METEKGKQSNAGAFKFIAFSLFGIFMFFVKIPYQDTTKIPIDIITSVLKEKLVNILPYAVLLLCLSLIHIYIGRQLRGLENGAVSCGQRAHQRLQKKLHRVVVGPDDQNRTVRLVKHPAGGRHEVKGRLRPLGPCPAF